MKNKTLIIVAVILFTILTAFFYRTFFTDSSFFIQDIMFQFHPFRVFAAEEVQKGNIPLWNPYIYSGMPFLANMQSAVFYPFTILFYVFSFPFALKCFVLVHLFLAGLFMYLLLASFKVRRISALAGAVVFMLNGYIITRIQFLSILGSVVWLPLIFLLIRKMEMNRESMDSKSRFSIDPVAVMLGIVLSLQFFAGHTQIMVYTVFFVLAYLLISPMLRLQSGAGKAHFPWLKLLVTAVVALGISMIQFLPSFEFIRNSIRGEGIEYSVATKWSLQPRELVNFVLPFLLKNPVVNNFQNLGDFWQKCFYTGIFPLFLFITGMFMKRRRKLAWFLAGFFLIVIFLALGEHNPLYHVMYNNIPFFNIFRYPSSIMFLGVFILSIAASLGLNGIIDMKISKVIPLGILFMIVADLFLFGIKLNPVIDEKIFRERGDKTDYLVENSNGSRFMLTPATDYDKYATGSTQYDVWRNMKDNLYGNINMPFHLYNTGGQDVRVKWYDDFLNALESSASPGEADNLISLLGVNHILSRNEIRDERYRLARDGRIRIYKNTKCMPRAWIAGNTKVMDRKGVLAYLKTASFNPSEDIVFEKGIHDEIPGIDSQSDLSSECKISLYSPGRVEVNAVLDSPGWLVLSDTYFPGWKAYVNGKTRDIYRANYVLRAVLLEEGENRVVFKYVPVTFIIGTIITLVILLILVLIIIPSTLGERERGGTMSIPISKYFRDFT